MTDRRTPGSPVYFLSGWFVVNMNTAHLYTAESPPLRPLILREQRYAKLTVLYVSRVRSQVHRVSVLPVGKAEGPLVCCDPSLVLGGVYLQCISKVDPFNPQIQEEP